MKTLILGLLILAGTCGSQKDKDKNTNYQELDDNPLTLILSDNYGGSETEQLLVLRDKKALKNFFTEVNMTRKPGLKIPEIDFSTEMVVIYCNGKTSDTPTSRIRGVLVEDNRMILDIENTKDNKSPSTAILMPFHLYKMPLTEKEIVLDNNK
ncbi:MAG: hypothetical protein ABJJ25_12535 [Eudoraea sp.]|uniref:hypothetical protein n=1 Tax=Eudoraea sp. TaxID=1979955 RepID=UPI0032642AD5